MTPVPAGVDKIFGGFLTGNRLSGVNFWQSTDRELPICGTKFPLISCISPK